MQILEAFRALRALDEDIFDVTTDGVKELSDFMYSDDLEDEVTVIDPEAATDDDLQDSYIGKVILDCCVCHSKLYKSKEDIVIDEAGELANVGEDCPYCYTPDGFKVIGEVAAFGKEPETQVDAVEETEEDIQEAFGKKKEELYTISEKGEDGKWTPIHSFDKKEDALKFKAQYEEENPDVKFMLHTGKKFESLGESIKDLSITTDDTHMEMTSDENGKVTVTSEPVTHEEDEAEVIAPVSVETEMEIEANSEEEVVEEEPVEEEPVEESTEESAEEEVDIDIDEIDDSSMTELGESYLKRVYENVKAYKVIGVRSCGNKLIVEGKIKFSNNNIKRTNFIFEAHTSDGNGNVTFRGSNEITGKGNSFLLRGNVKDSKLKMESLSYRYKALHEGKEQRVRGTVSLKG